MRAWSHFFPNAHIYGLDIDPKAVRYLENETRIDAYAASSMDKAAVAALPFPKGLDLIIDDGLHTWEANQATLRATWPNLRVGGLFCIEDVIWAQSPWMERWSQLGNTFPIPSWDHTDPDIRALFQSDEVGAIRIATHPFYAQRIACPDNWGNTVTMLRIGATYNNVFCLTKTQSFETLPTAPPSAPATAPAAYPFGKAYKQLLGPKVTQVKTIVRIVGLSKPAETDVGTPFWLAACDQAKVSVVRDLAAPAGTTAASAGDRVREVSCDTSDAEAVTKALEVVTDVDVASVDVSLHSFGKLQGTMMAVWQKLRSGGVFCLEGLYWDDHDKFFYLYNQTSSEFRTAVLPVSFRIDVDPFYAELHQFKPAGGSSSNMLCAAKHAAQLAEVHDNNLRGCQGH